MSALTTDTNNKTNTTMNNLEATIYTTLSTNANVYDGNGKLTQSGVTVIQIDEPKCSSNDSRIVIGNTSHASQDIEQDGDTLTSLAASWTVKL